MNDYQALYRRSLEEPAGFWGDAAATLHWEKPWDSVLDLDAKPVPRWFAGGELNTCYNAVDRHVENGRGEPQVELLGRPAELAGGMGQKSGKASEAQRLAGQAAVEQGGLAGRYRHYLETGRAEPLRGARKTLRHQHDVVDPDGVGGGFLAAGRLDHAVVREGATRRESRRGQHRVWAEQAAVGLEMQHALRRLHGAHPVAERSQQPLQGIDSGPVASLRSPDEDLAFRILALNTEKAHNLKDKSLEVVRMAREHARRRPRADRCLPARLVALGEAAGSGGVGGQSHLRRNR